MELARELDRLPARLVVYGIEGEDFEAGEGLTDPRPGSGRRAGAELYHELSGAS